MISGTSTSDFPPEQGHVLSERKVQPLVMQSEARKRIDVNATSGFIFVLLLQQQIDTYIRRISKDNDNFKK